MPEKLDLTKQYIEIPNFYTYTEQWCDKNIREVHDLDLICKTKDAEYELCRFLEEIGSGMYLIIKKFNRKAKNLSRDKLEKLYKKDFLYLKNLNYLILDCLWIDKHPSHLNLEQSVELVKKLNPKKAILTNLSPVLDYDNLKKILPKRITPAYDGLTINL